MSSNRSPRYPNINLGDAILAVEKIFAKEGRSPVADEVAVQHLGYGGLNGASQKTLSALRKYGLVEDVSGGVRVSQDAIVIVANKGSPESRDRIDAIRRAAFRVELFSDLHEAFGARPSEQNLASQLVVRGFSQEGAPKAARSYLATMSLVSQGVQNGDEPAASEAEETGADDGLSTPNGAGSSNERADQPAATSHKAGVSADEKEWLSGPLSKSTSYRLIVQGEMGPREIAKLVRILQVQREVLEDDDIKEAV